MRVSEAVFEFGIGEAVPLSEPGSAFGTWTTGDRRDALGGL